MRYYPFILFLFVLFYSCTTDITVDLPDPVSKIVVEGVIEQDEAPYVFLTRNAPFFGSFDLNDFEQYLVRGAKVTVSDGNITDTLSEVCFTVSNDGRSFLVCIYIAANPILKGEIGKTYFLRIESEDEVLTAQTKIPDLLALDSLWWEPHENPENDSLVSVIARITDPDTVGNYVRYFSQRNSEPFYPVFVTDDRFFNGQTFRFPLRRGQDPDAEFDNVTYGYYWRGDTVTVKWAAIDKPHYDFWNTLSYEMSSGGPFGSATVIKSNINGGLGVWGGYAAYYETIYIPE